MSKGLEALKTIDKTFRYIEYDDEGYKFNEPCKMLNDCDEQFKTIEEELTRLEQIDNAKPSEDVKEDRNIIRTDLKELESIKAAKSGEALSNLEELEYLIEYFTRLDYVEPIVRGEIQQKFKDIYWNKLPHLATIKQALMKAISQDQVIKECIKLLSVDGENTKGKVKELLEGLK